MKPVMRLLRKVPRSTLGKEGSDTTMGEKQISQSKNFMKKRHRKKVYIAENTVSGAKLKKRKTNI